MKLIFCLILILPIILKAQPFAGMAINTNSVEMNVGYAFSGLEITAAYKAPFLHNRIATIASLTFSEAYYFSDSMHYLRAGTGIAMYNQKLAPNYRAEIGRRCQQGTLFLLIDYCKNIFLMAGIKIYIK